MPQKTSHPKCAPVTSPNLCDSLQFVLLAHADSCGPRRGKGLDPGPVKIHARHTRAGAWACHSGSGRLEWLQGIGVIPGPATESHVVNRGTPEAPLGPPLTVSASLRLGGLCISIASHHGHHTCQWRYTGVSDCKCDAGYTGLDGNSCAACPAGKFKSAPGVRSDRMPCERQKWAAWAAIDSGSGTTGGGVQVGRPFGARRRSPVRGSVRCPKK